MTSFKSASGNAFSVPHAAPQQDVLARASDWKVQFDLDMSDGMSKTREGEHSAGHRTSLPFPPEIAVVSGKGSRPDGVIWSLSSKTVIWIELTSPWEDNMSKRHFEKKKKYNQLAIDLRNPRRVGGAWSVYPFEVEVGARGVVNEQPWMYMCSNLGFSSDARQRLKWAVNDAAQHCSHLIFMCRFHRKWEPQPLLKTHRWSEDSQ